MVKQLWVAYHCSRIPQPHNTSHHIPRVIPVPKHPFNPINLFVSIVVCSTSDIFNLIRSMIPIYLSYLYFIPLSSLNCNERSIAVHAYFGTDLIFLHKEAIVPTQSTLCCHQQSNITHTTLSCHRGILYVMNGIGHHLVQRPCITEYSLVTLSSFINSSYQSSCFWYPSKVRGCHA